jgi:very-short-patch-repair endonuclease
VENSLGKLEYHCRYCLTKYHFKTRVKEKIIKHVYDCKNKTISLKENEDFVICKICNLHGRSLGKHIIDYHKISVKDYNKKFGFCISKKSQNIFSKVCKTNGDWINREKLKGTDLSEHFKKLGKSISKSIMNSPESRKKRSDTMKIVISKLLKDPKYLLQISNNAKITSARPDIIEKRSKVLSNWRENNPEKFEQFWKKMISTYQTKPEKLLFSFLIKIKGFNFKKNQFVKSINFSNKYKKKQVDFGDKSKRVYIEYDGQIHFLPVKGEEVLDNIIKKDKELDNHILEHGWTLIRVGYDQFIDRQNIKNCKFKFSALKNIVKILKKNTPGIYRIGEVYGKH